MLLINICQEVADRSAIHDSFHFSMSDAGIGTSSTVASAGLEVSASNKGFLTSRVLLTGTSDVSTIASPATGVVVYSTSTAETTSTSMVPCFYVYNGSKWVKLAEESTTTVSSITSIGANGSSATMVI